MSRCISKTLNIVEKFIFFPVIYLKKLNFHLFMRKIFKSFFNLDDYGLKLMKIKNSVSQNITILP